MELMVLQGWARERGLVPFLLRRINQTFLLILFPQSFSFFHVLLTSSILLRSRSRGQGFLHHDVILKNISPLFLASDVRDSRFRDLQVNSFSWSNYFFYKFTFLIRFFHVTRTLSEKLGIKMRKKLKCRKSVEIYFSSLFSSLLRFAERLNEFPRLWTEHDSLEVNSIIFPQVAFPVATFLVLLNVQFSIIFIFRTSIVQKDMKIFKKKTNKIHILVLNSWEKLCTSPNF